MEIKVTKIETTNKEVSTVVGIRCDLCKEICNDPAGWKENALNNTEPHIRFVNKFKSYTVNSFPNYYYRKGVIIDFCPDCATRVLIALRAMGVEINKFEEEM
jgi:hypothetical protein